MEELHSELRAAEEECEALPKELQEIKAALARETAELQRQESGDLMHMCKQVHIFFQNLDFLQPTALVFCARGKF